MKARDNPFTVDRIQAIRYVPIDTTFDQLLLRLKELDYRAALVGPNGSGKTTLLEDLDQALTAQGKQTDFVFVNDTTAWNSQRRAALLSKLIPGAIVLLDGADSLSRLAWPSVKGAIFKRRAGLIITSHRPGLLPTLIECTTTAELLRQIVTRLLGSEYGIEPPLIETLHARHDGNIRDALRELYDIWAVKP